MYIIWSLIFDFTSNVYGVIDSPFLTPGHYALKGDINIGVLGSVHQRDKYGVCSDQNMLLDITSMSVTVLQQPEAVYFTVKEINERNDILPNISLGFVFLDGCLGDLTSLSRTVYFLPDYEEKNMYNSSSHQFRHFDVESVIIHGPSRITTSVAGLLGSFQIPSLGTISTSDDLSDKEKYPYFSRICPPDNFQTKALVDLMKKFGWSYISLLYAAGSYGQNAAKFLNYWVKETEGICIAFSYMLPYDGPTVKREISYAVDQLIKYKNARVVVIILEDTIMSDLFHTVDEHGYSGYFLWLGSDSVEGIHATNVATLAQGMIYTGLSGMDIPKDPSFLFDEYFEFLNPWNATSGNPWLRNGWKDMFNCLWDDLGSKNSFCSKNNKSCFCFKNFGEQVGYELNVNILTVIDAVYVYSYALDKLISDNCPEAMQNKSILDTCITGDLLNKVTRSLKVETFRGPIQFDNKGDFLGGYDIRQLQLNENGKFISRNIGNWDKLSGKVTIQREKIMFPSENKMNIRSSTDIPESVCSKPCGKGMAKFKLDLPCCWHCHKCYEYEYVTDNGTFCKSCPMYVWPEDITQSYCVDIEAGFLTIKHPVAMAVLAATLLGLLIWGGICQQFIQHRRHRLILACDREQSWCQLIGILLTFAVTLTYISKPTMLNCTIRRIGFNISVSILYSPILIKTFRVYRIFKLSKKGVKMPRFVSRTVQRLLVGTVCIIQIICVAVLEKISPSYAELRMPIRQKKYVELVCTYELWAFLIPLCYNMTLIFFCAVLGLLTRKLPENFNEAWFIFISVATTLFAWVILLPTYFNMFYGYHQEALLAFCLILSSYIMLFCHYIPKIYAITFVTDDEKLRIKKTNMAITTISTF